MYAFRDQNGKILALCIHFRVQSGDSGYMARESCRQGPLFASSGQKSRIARRTCQRCPAHLPRGPLPSHPRPPHCAPLCPRRRLCFPLPAPAIRVPYRRKRAKLCSQLNAGIKMGSPNGDPIKKLFGFAERLPDALQPLRRANELALSYLEELHQANELALSYLDHSTRQGFGSYVVGLSRNSFTVDLHAALVDHATSIAC